MSAALKWQVIRSGQKAETVCLLRGQRGHPINSQDLRHRLMDHMAETRCAEAMGAGPASGARITELGSSSPSGERRRIKKLVQLPPELGGLV